MAISITELKGKMPNEVIESLAERGIKKLNEPQEMAINSKLLSGKNIVVASPTASGKTLIAELAMLKTVLGERKKAIYIAPMRALASEKYEEFKAAYPYLKVALSIGDLDSLDPWLSSYDIIFASTEKFDSLMRHGIDWLYHVGCIVLDEVHMLDDLSRGPTLEILITKLRRYCKDVQIVALSATIGNANEIAQWLDANLVTSDYRPIKLEKGIVLNQKVYYKEGEENLEGESLIPEIRVMEDVLSKKKQLIVFYSTKRNAEAGAEKLKKVALRMIDAKTKEGLASLADRVLGVLGKPTAQCEKLSDCVRHGVAFHHGGLVNEQRKMIEDAFKNNLIKVICSTTTLAYGINMPAHTVLVRDTTRYSGVSGAQKLGVNEVTQLFGRAGRPKYDTQGRALLLAKYREEIMELYGTYMSGALDPINSKLGVLPILRSHLLGFISTNFLNNREAMSNFFSETFYGYQYDNMREINNNIDKILLELAGWGFIEKIGSQYSATKVGKRVSELYIDPLTARFIIECLFKERDEIGNLFMISNTLEMRPYVKVTQEAEERFQFYKNMVSDESVERSMGDYEFGYYDPLKPFSTALMLNDWISEMPEPMLVKKYGTTPGALFSKVTNADWLLYSAMEIASLMKVRHAKILEVRVRMRYGIKKELLDLIRLRGVGRVRARIMFDNGIKTVSGIREDESQEKLKKLLGKELAKSIIEQLPEMN